MNGASAGIGSSINVYNKIQNKQQINSQDIKTAMEDLKKNGIDVDNYVANSIKEEINKNTTQNVAQGLPNLNENIQLNIFESKDNSIVLVTDLSDKNGNIIIASMKIDGKGIIDDIDIESNVMTSVYGKDNYDYNIDKKTGEHKAGWAELNKDKIIYDIDEGIKKNLQPEKYGLQLSRENSEQVSIDKSISSNNKKVNDNTTNYSMRYVSCLLSSNI